MEASDSIGGAPAPVHSTAPIDGLGEAMSRLPKGPRLVIYPGALRGAVRGALLAQAARRDPTTKVTVIEGDGVVNEATWIAAVAKAGGADPKHWNSWNRIDDLITGEIIGDEESAARAIIWIDADQLATADLEAFEAAYTFLVGWAKMAMEGGAPEAESGMWGRGKPYEHLQLAIAGRQDSFKSLVEDAGSFLFFPRDSPANLWRTPSSWLSVVRISGP